MRKDRPRRGRHNRLAAKARATGTEWALGIEARAHALLSDGKDAARWFHAALGHLGQTRVRAELARTHLLYGERLRLHKLTVDAMVNRWSDDDPRWNLVPVTARGPLNLPLREACPFVGASNSADLAGSHG